MAEDISGGNAKVFRENDETADNDNKRHNLRRRHNLKRPGRYIIHVAEVQKSQSCTEPMESSE